MVSLIENMLYIKYDNRLDLMKYALVDITRNTTVWQKS